MSIWLTYLIKTLLLPQSSFLFLMLWGCFRMHKRQKPGFSIVLSVLSAWYILSMPIVGRALCKSLESTPVMQVAELDHFKPQAIVTLGGGIRGISPEYGRDATPNFQSLERLRYTAKIARLTQLPILITGGKVIDESLPAEADILAEALKEDYGFEARWLETKSHNTAENATNTYAQLSQQHISKIILITHAAHMPRALREFQQAGFEVLAAPTSFMGDSTPNNFLSFLPSAQAFMLSNAAIHEYIGQFWGTLKKRFISPIQAVASKPKLQLT